MNNIGVRQFSFYTTLFFLTAVSYYCFAKKTSKSKNLQQIHKNFSIWGYVKDPTKRHSSYPYLSGDTFRAFCDFVIDETEVPFDPAKVREGNVIFISPRLLEPFFKYYHPLIKVRYKILTHNDDMDLPGKFKHFLQDPKIIAWFGQNVVEIHPKLIPIPIGIANLYWGHGNIRAFNSVRTRLKDFEKNKLLYMNFNQNTNLAERKAVYDIFSNKSFCHKCEPKDIHSYLIDCAESKFVLSPRGNGLDCHRTWEALLMGAIPIVKTSASDQMYRDLPVLIINDWSEINEDFLNRKYEEMKNKNYNYEKVFADYWFKLIRDYK